MGLRFEFELAQKNERLIEGQKFIIDGDLIGMILPHDKGCEIQLKNGGQIVITNSYEDLRMITNAHTVEEIRHKIEEINLWN